MLKRNKNVTPEEAMAEACKENGFGYDPNANKQVDSIKVQKTDGSVVEVQNPAKEQHHSCCGKCKNCTCGKKYKE